MANTLKIRVDVTTGNQTVSQYTMAINDKIKFQNAHATGELEVKVKGSGQTPFCKGNEEEVPVITVPPASTSQAYHICNDFPSQQFAYEAMIAGSLKEDPIVIIEKANYFNFDLASALLGAASAVVVVFVLKGVMKTRTTRPQP